MYFLWQSFTLYNILNYQILKWSWKRWLYILCTVHELDLYHWSNMQPTGCVICYTAPQNPVYPVCIFLSYQCLTVSFVTLLHKTQYIQFVYFYPTNVWLCHLLHCTTEPSISSLYIVILPKKSELFAKMILNTLSDFVLEIGKFCRKVKVNMKFIMIVIIINKSASAKHHACCGSPYSCSCRTVAETCC